LHEEFQLTPEKIRVDRLSRHLYDIEKLMNSDFAEVAYRNYDLYSTIVEHRRTITPLRGIDYNNHHPSLIDPIPPNAIIAAWEEDYKFMQDHMIYGTSLPFPELISQLLKLKDRINAIQLP
jgi:hypothetical protein